MHINREKPQFLTVFSNEITMRIVKQKNVLPIDNLDTIVCKSQIKNQHGNLFPSRIRAILCGPSACGKTNVMLTLLTHKNGLRFENVYIFSKSLYQQKYEFLKNALSKVPYIKYFPFTANDDIVNPCDAKEYSIFIFDDVACDKQDNIKQYFCMGRHKKIDSFYLCQTYTHIPKHLIRDNANVLIIFKQDDMNLKHIYDDHVTTDMPFSQFKDVCSECWKDRYGFLVIVKDKEINEGRYRKGFDQYILL